MSAEDVSLGAKLAASGKYRGTEVAEPWLDGQPVDDAELLDDAAAFDPDEYEIQDQLHRLRIQREARRRLDEETRLQIVAPPIKPLDDLLAEPDAPARYRIDKLAPVGARIMLSAQYKAGKTTVVANLLRSLADAEPFLGRFDVKIPARRIVLLDDELGDDMLRRWLREQQIDNTAAVSTVSLRGRLGSFNLIDDRSRSEWIRQLADLGCDYLVLDCLRPVFDALGLDEHRDAGKFLVPFDAMLTEAGIGDALVVDHMGHTGERTRGDSRKLDWPDALWRLVRESDEPDSARYFSAFGRDVNVPEGRLGMRGRRLTYSDGNRFDAKTEAAIRAVLTLLSGDAVHGGDGLSGSTIERELGGEHTQKAVRAAVRRLVEYRRIGVVRGSRGANLHSITRPCRRCGMPMLTDQPQHETCGDADVDGLFT